MIDSSLRYARPARRTPVRAWYATATSPITMKPPMAGAWAAGNHSADGLPSIAGAAIRETSEAGIPRALAPPPMALMTATLHVASCLAARTGAATVRAP